MLADTLSVTYGGSARTLKKIKEANNASEYFFRTNTLSLTLQVGHTIPANGKKAETHAVTLRVAEFDALGVQTIGFDVMTRVRNLEGFMHDSTKMLDAIVGFSTAFATIDQDILERQA